MTTADVHHPRDHPRRSLLSLLGYRQIATYLAARTLSALAGQCYAIILIFLVFDRLHAVADVGYVLGADAAGGAVLRLVGGLAADRLPRRTMLATGTGLRSAVLACVCALALSGLLSLPALVVLAFLGGTAGALSGPAAAGLVPEVAGSKELIAGTNGVVQGAYQAASLAGPALGGLLVATIGARAALIVPAALGVTSALLT
jgi:MFS family permease